jgi:hypothetical protein
MATRNMVGTLLRVHRRALPALIAAGAVLATGCGATTSSDEEDPPILRGEQRLVAQAIEDLQDAATEGDEERVCRELLAEDLAERLGGTGQECEPTVRDALDNTDTTDLTVRAVTVRGTTATARVEAERGDADRVTTVGLVKEGARWRISRL